MDDPGDTTEGGDEDVAGRLARAELVDDAREVARQKQAVKARLLGDPMPETRIDRFVVLEKLGAGGMGVVYAAYDPSLDRKVAIKLVRAWGTEIRSEDRDRLVREARALARLSHPNVVAVHEVGLYHDDVFIVMELVRGRTLREHLPAGRTPWRDVVRSYLQAGEGLAAAHDAGIVHRDFKPDNAIVGDDGRVRVVDFGIARTHDFESTDAATSRTIGNATPLTGTGALIGTPAYMAPEQRAGLPAQARSDQYSFCAALFESLVGALPDDAKAQGAQLPTRLRRALARGLADAPADRFADMRALSNELRATVGPGTSRAGVVVAIAGAAVVGTLWLARGEVCPDPARELDGVWSDAERASVRAAAEQVGASTERSAGIVERELDRYAEAWTGARRDACEAHFVRRSDSEALFDRRMRCLDRDRQALRELVGLLGEHEPKTWAHAVDAVVALAPIDACADVDALTAEAPLPSDPETLAAIDDVHARIDRAHALESLGRLPEARPLVDGAVHDAALLGHRRTEAEAIGAQARAHDLAGREREAAAAYEDAVWRADAARADALAAELLANEMRVAAKLGKRDEAAAIERRIGGVLERISAPARVENEFLRGRYELAALRSDFDAADGFARDGIALAVREGGERSLGVADHLNNLAIVQAQRGKLTEAEISFASALAIRREWQDDAHPNVMAHRMGLANVYAMTGRMAESRAVFESIVADGERSLRGPNAIVANALVSLARIREQERDFDGARAMVDRAIAILEQTVGGGHPRMMPPLLLRGLLEQGLQRYDDARATFGRVLAIAEALEPDHQYKRLVWGNMATLELERGNAKEARALAAKALALQLKIHGADHPDYGQYAYILGQTELADGAVDDAIVHLREAIASLEGGGPQAAGAWGGAQLELARALLKQSPKPDRAGAIAAAELALERFEAMGDREAADRAKAFLTGL